MKYFKFMSMLLMVATLTFTACSDDGGSGSGDGGSNSSTELTDAEAVAEDTGNLDITYASGDSATSVTGTLTLSLTGSCGTTITWSSDNTGVVENDGTVTRPWGGNVTVTLTATITKNSETATKTFSLTVIACDNPATPTLTSGNTSIGVSWSAVTGAASYTVYYNTSDSSSSATEWASGITATSATITGLTNGTTYYVWIKAVNSTGTSDYSPSSSSIPLKSVVFQSAVQTGGTSATVDSTGLTLTFDVDPDILSADNITVTGATKGALTGTGTTRSLAISDINVANEGNVSVSITSPSGYSITGSPQTAAVYRITEINMTIGMDYRGGKLAYILQSGDTGYDATVPHGIIAAAGDQDGGSGIQWGGFGADMSGTGYTTGTALGDGQSNTETIVNFFDTIYHSGSPSVTYYTYDWVSLTTGTENFTDGTSTYAMDYRNDGNVAAKLCADYEVTVSGVTYDDWYLPSKDELNKLYGNKAAIGGFANDFYWSSSGGLANGAWGQNFLSGGQGNYVKGNTSRVRAVRAF